ncbi:GNAT family N-acetyltransferase [Amycolatopsis anabasis]|uniref:GNAT family N-acetyltransferase n=1 Tax=Amycolatopsis anabasis TaxID=1840409 RepID=UPI001FE9ACD3|nr:GNAT family N-acetyltransferase [Amycolatopsis anabasis]
MISPPPPPDRPVDSRPEAALGTVVRAWVHGWALSRNIATPVEVSGAFRLDVDTPGQLVRYVFTEFDPESLRRRAAALVTPGTWLKVCAGREVVEGALPPPWQVGVQEFLMTTALRPPGAAPAVAGYRTETVTSGAATDVLVWAPDGERAAAGRVAVWGDAAVVDQVETRPEHRRRGLGALVMDLLGAAARARGATRGVLVATADGRALYRSLGWSLRSPVTPAWLPL